VTRDTEDDAWRVNCMVRIGHWEYLMFSLLSSNIFFFPPSLFAYESK